MIEFQPINYADKSKFYHELRSEISAMSTGIWITNLANTSAALMAHLPKINWAGFYLASGKELVLGPFQGLPACLTIPLGKGVCGTAAQDRKSLNVPDVELFKGHISCDSRSRSEAVIPLVHGVRLLGVLDIDSPEKNRFDARDIQELEFLVTELVQATPWPPQFF